jgi:hypothetical protein
VAKYEDYAQAERDAGREPLEMPQWRAQRMHEAQQAKLESDPAEATAQHNEPKPEPSPETNTIPEMPATMTFWSPNRFRVEVMQAGHKTVVGGVVVPVAHRTIEFNEYHWTADMENDDHVEKVEWLMKCPAYKKGEIVLVPGPRPTKGIQIRTGPRTTSTPRLERIERPAGQLSARLDG